MINFTESETRINLMRAFAGESQARNRYTFAAAQARTQKLHIVEAIFTFTANQEKEHAEIFYGHLRDCAGDNITIDAGYPVHISAKMPELLRMAEHGEREEHDPIYPTFAAKAEEEGFAQIAAHFRLIAEIEKTHAERFALLADLLGQNKLFAADTPTRWLCLNCGHVHEGIEAPEKCPVCDHDRGYFARPELAPFTA